MPTYAPERGDLGETLLSTFVDSTQIADSTTEAILVPDYKIPANYLRAGTTLRGTVRGVCSNVVTTPGTLIYRVRCGPLTLSTTAVVASAAIGLDTTAQTNAPFVMQFNLTCRVAGASGKMVIQGQVQQFNVLASTAANLLPILLPSTSFAELNVDTTVQNLLSVSAKFSVNTAGTNITATSYILENLT